MAYSSYLDREVNAPMWRAMAKSADHLRLLRECGCDLAYQTSEGVSAATFAAEGGWHDALRFLLDEVRVPDANGELRAALQA